MFKALSTKWALAVLQTESGKLYHVSLPELGVKTSKMECRIPSAILARSSAVVRVFGITFRISSYPVIIEQQLQATIVFNCWCMKLTEGPVVPIAV